MANNLIKIIATPYQEWTIAEKIFSVSFFPTILTAPCFFYFSLLSSGYESDTALYICQLPALALIILFERVFPNKKDWNKSHGDIGADIGHNLTITIAFGLTWPLALNFSLWLADTIRLVYAGSLWPSSWPVVAQVFLALIVMEIPLYWFHRLQHEIPFLWRFHSIHHSAKRLYWLNTSRNHFIDLMLNVFPGLIILAILGVGEVVMGLFSLFTGILGFLIHCNLKFRLGFLNWIFMTAPLHRWHHSKDINEGNLNYGFNLVFSDFLFGTRYFPKDRDQPEELGIKYPKNFPDKFLPQLLAPFRWKKILASSKQK